MSEPRTADITAGTDGVTAVVTRRVKPGHEAAYEDRLHRLQADARGVPGYLGASVLRPAAAASGTAGTYTTVIRFASVDALQAYERSDLHARFVAGIAPHVEADAVWQRLTGLEFWFAPPPGTVVPQPDRLRMALVMIVVVFGLVLSIGSAVGVLAAGWPYPLRLLLTIVIEVLLMTYWLMPWLTRRLAPWIYPARRRA